MHRVKTGETIDGIAKKYKANSEKIIAFNHLPADGSIKAGDVLIVPDGVMPVYRPSKSRTYFVARKYKTVKGNHFPYGQCTWYIAQRRSIPWYGHAKYWLSNARSYGFKTGKKPVPGAIMVLSSGGRLGRLYGHVAYVEAVKGSWVTISEMNYLCWACKSVRTLNIHDKRIKGYIY